MVGHFNTPPSTIDRISRQKISLEDFGNTINQEYQIDIYGIFLSNDSKIYIFFMCSW